jgi:predicted transcriptional regulator
VTNYVGEHGLFYSPSREKYRTSKFLNLRKNRSHFEIFALILEAGNKDCAIQYSLMKHANTSHVQLKKYLGSLIRMGFIETNVKDGRILYRTSKKGNSFLAQYYVLLGMLANAQTQNKSALDIQQQSATQIVAHLRHNR